MNIEKLAKHLKEFTLDEINMIAEFDCKTELEHLLNTHKISFEQGVYKYVEEQRSLNFGVFIKNSAQNAPVKIEDAVNYFLNNYVLKYCSRKTYRNYRATFNFDILPNIKMNSITNFTENEIKQRYLTFENMEFKAIRLKNTMALLKQFLKFCKTEGFIKNYADFQVKRITSKNEFSMNRIIFEGD